RVHTATSTTASNAAMPGFDTGGVAPGQSTGVGFGQAGTYLYNSATDCIDRGNSPAFDCGPFSITVTSTAAPAIAVASAPATTPGTQVAAPASVATNNVTINDTAGFVPASVTIKAGQAVTWTNGGSQTHTVVINQNPAGNSAPVPW